MKRRLLLGALATLLLSVVLTISPRPAHAAGYSRVDAANWAYTNAEPDPYNWEDCTLFVSLALENGYLPEDATWNTYTNHGHLTVVPATPTATVSYLLVGYLINMGYAQEYTLDFTGSNAAVPMEPGDIIAYDFGYKPASGYGFRADHLSIVVGIASGDYPYVSEWGHPGYYYQRGWSWSEANGEWLQTEYNDAHYGGNPDNHSGVSIQAHLLHFVIGTYYDGVTA